MNKILLTGSGWPDEVRDKEFLILQRIFNGSVYIIGKEGPMLLPVKNRDNESSELCWKEIGN